MTQIDFYTQAADRLHTTCRLVAKARSQGLRVTVYCPDGELAGKLDRMLWAVPATGFLPHCTPDDPLAAVTPVVIDGSGDVHLHDDLLINLHAQWPASFSRYRRLAEIVSVGEEDRALARERYRFYRDRGYEIRTHDLSGQASKT
jgi:DNA polymerase III subunit chi